MRLLEITNHWGNGAAAKFLHSFNKWEKAHSQIMDKVNLELEKRNENTIYIDDIYVLEVSDRNKGIASSIMNELIRLADIYKITLTLIPTPQDEDTPYLPKWYAKFGFDWDDNGMIRLPE